MKIEKDQDGKCIKFYSKKRHLLCKLRIVVQELNFDTWNKCAFFTQEEIKSLLPYLEAFAQTGTLEPQESPLQGEKEQSLEELISLKDKIALEDQLEIVQEAGVAMAASIVDQGKRTEALKDMVRESKHPDLLLSESAQLLGLGEDGFNHE